MARKQPEVQETDKQRITREELEAALKTNDPYEKLKKQDKPREVELPAVKLPAKDKAGGNVPQGTGEYKTISQAISENADMTDMQTALSMLFPKEANINYGSLMVADISPDVFLPGMHMSAMDEIMSSDPKQPIDVNKIYMKHYTIWSIGLDREGRMDVADIAGAARAEKKIQSSLGLRGIS
jgi:hypothetical protein